MVTLTHPKAVVAGALVVVRTQKGRGQKFALLPSDVSPRLLEISQKELDHDSSRTLRR